jgi:tetratricopeptide (TPR) repeat protein/DNA-binding winged helix-turn-helix (wHTH) protein
LNGQNQQIYRVADFEIDASQFSLKRAGQAQHLRQKTFQVLIYLLEQRQRLVTKEELFEQIWTDSAVTDNALDQCLAEIRKTLGDDSRQPRFVKTIPRAGYRFIGSVEEIRATQAPAPSLISDTRAPEKSESEDAITARPLGSAPVSQMPVLWIARRSVVILIAAFLIPVTAAGLYLVRRRSVIPSLASVTLPQNAGKRPVAVMFFDNRSKSADLDWLREGLADMLITDLSRSKNLAVLSRQQLQLLLERAGHGDKESIRLNEALDLARKSQAKIVILGGFARLGEQIRIDVQLHDAGDGQLLAAERLVAEQPSEILTQIDLLCLKLMSHLGASTSEQDTSQGLGTEMTKNLEAYRDYSLGVEKARAFHSEEALALLQKAVAIDPQFAMAYARIGYTYSVSWNRVEEGKPYLEKAFQLSARLTEKDKLNIAAWYAIANLDYPSAINAFQGIVTRYPLEVEAYKGLGHLLRGEDRLDEAIEVFKQGLVMDSGAKDLYNELGATYMELGRHEEAIAMFRHYVDLAPLEPNAHDSLGAGLQWAGRYEDAVEEYNRALGLKPDFEIAVIHLGNAYFAQGQYREAIQQYHSYVKIVSWVEERARGYLSIADAERMRGRLAEAERVARLAFKSDKNNVSQLLLITLQKGDLKTAATLVDLLESRYKSGHFVSRGEKVALRLPYYFQGYFDLKTGHSAEAIANFKEALKHRPPYWNSDTFEDCLANAYFELGRLDEAVAEYERILRLNPNYPLVHYHLARIYERKGQPDRARASYESFLQVWQNADPEVPEIVTARKMVDQASSVVKGNTQ